MIVWGMGWGAVVFGVIWDRYSYKDLINKRINLSRIF